MKKFYRLCGLLVLLIILSTYNSISFNEDIINKNSLFNIKNIEILNNILIDKELIKKKLKNIYNKNIFILNRNEIEDPLKRINFLHKVKVKKKFPNTIVITLYETSPVAKLIKNNNKYILDDYSNLLLANQNIDDTNLPSIFGEKADVHFINFYNRLKKNNFPYSKIKNYYYFRINRWDLELLDDKIIKFPSNNINEAIKKSISLLKNKKLKNYKVIDLRIDDKIIIE